MYYKYKQFPLQLHISANQAPSITGCEHHSSFQDADEPIFANIKPKMQTNLYHPLKESEKEFTVN
jgi:hypothetical protein